ncbi:MAG: Na/Pi symporter [Bacteroidia bacterium]
MSSTLIPEKDSSPQTSGSGPEIPQPINPVEVMMKVGKLLGVLFLFLLTLKLMGGSFKLFGKGLAEDLVGVTTNPFIGLFIGMLATAVIQSSSTTTSIIVGLVAVGQMSILSAVPLIMGANIGTSVTSTIVAMGHIGNRKEYEKAVAGASVHDFFNIITVIILFTLEMTTHALSGSAIWLSSFFEAQEGEKVSGILFFVGDTAKWITSLTISEGFPKGNPYVTLPLSLFGLFFTLQMLSKVLKSIIIGRVERGMNQYIFGKPLASLLTGFAITTAVQSSSITTSLMVPLIATDKLSLRRAFPFLMGANLGTTTTALMVALFMDSEIAGAGLAIAFVHILFNLFGVLILFPIRKLRDIPISLAEGLGRLTLKNRLAGIGYIIVVFFLLPGILIFASQQF